jgi:hypothetical protein
MFEPPYPFWSIWKEFGLLLRLFIELLCAIGVYCLFTTLRTALRLHAIKKQNLNERMIPIEEALAPLYRSLANTRQVILATFYLFGFVLFFILPNVENTLGARSTAAELKQILGSFVLCCEFAENVFFIFLVLHVAQWLVYIMLNRCSKRLKSGLRSREEKVDAVGT